MYRQGDLLFIKADRVKGRPVNTKNILYSEITGHSHSITEGQIYVNDGDTSTRENRARWYLSIPVGGSEVIHPEHGAIPLQEGIYEVIRQREVDGYVAD